MKNEFKERKCFKLKKKGTEIGKVDFTETPHEIHIDYIEVKPHLRGQGLAKSIIEQISEYARRLGKKKITAEVEGIDAPQLSAFLLKHDERFGRIEPFDASMKEVISFLRSVKTTEKLSTILGFNAEDLEKLAEKPIGLTFNSPSQRAFEANMFRLVRREPTEEHGQLSPKKYILIGQDGEVMMSNDLHTKFLKLPGLAISFFRLLYEKNLDNQI